MQPLYPLPSHYFLVSLFFIKIKADKDTRNCKMAENIKPYDSAILSLGMRSLVFKITELKAARTEMIKRIKYKIKTFPSKKFNSFLLKVHSLCISPIFLKYSNKEKPNISNKEIFVIKKL